MSCETYFQYFLRMREVYHLPPSRDGVKFRKPSNGVIRIWFNSGSVVVNGKRPRPSDLVEHPIESLVLFPKGRTVTLL